MVGLYIPNYPPTSNDYYHYTHHCTAHEDGCNGLINTLPIHPVGDQAGNDISDSLQLNNTGSGGKHLTGEITEDEAQQYSQHHPSASVNKYKLTDYLYTCPGYERYKQRTGKSERIVEVQRDVARNDNSARSQPEDLIKYQAESNSEPDCDLDQA